MFSRTLNKIRLVIMIILSGKLLKNAIEIGMMLSIVIRFVE